MESTPSSAADPGLPLSLEVASASVRSSGAVARLDAEEVRSADLSVDSAEELWKVAGAENVSLSREEFSRVLESVGQKANFGLAPDSRADAAQQAAFFRSLHLEELALAHACALGREAAWEQFVERYRAPLVHAATAITSSAGLGRDLAEGLYAELYGLREQNGERKCPLASYSGRGSLLGWLRTTLVQRYRDHYRRTHRETPLEEIDAPAASASFPATAELTLLSAAVGAVLERLGAEDRFLLAAYFLDRQTLLQVARTLHVHEATISRRLKRMAEDMRKQLLGELRSRGLSQAAAVEALGTDPRDIEINLRALLQTSQVGAFSQKRAPADAEGSGSS